MEALSFQQIQCPYCGEMIEMQVDGSAGDQAYVEDCSVCCSPIEVRLSSHGDGWRLEVSRGDD
ncbi:MAG: CPXCG motif-containing cysteine-rich protein [Sedimenticolaceae bacterium]|jgi:hypothetical protein